jgi:hypothetical protein
MVGIQVSGARQGSYFDPPFGGDNLSSGGLFLELLWEVLD